MLDVLLGSSPKLTEFQKGKRQHGWRYFRITRKHFNSYMATLRSRIPDKPNLRRDCQIRKPERKKNSFSAAGVGKQPKTVVARNNFVMVFANFCTISSINSWKLRCFFLHLLSYVYIYIYALLHWLHCYAYHAFFDCASTSVIFFYAAYKEWRTMFLIAQHRAYWQSPPIVFRYVQLLEKMLLAFGLPRGSLMCRRSLSGSWRSPRRRFRGPESKKGRDPSQRCLDWMEYDQSDDIDQATKYESIFCSYEQLKSLAGRLLPLGRFAHSCVHQKVSLRTGPWNKRKSNPNRIPMEDGRRITQSAQWSLNGIITPRYLT